MFVARRVRNKIDPMTAPRVASKQTFQSEPQCPMELVSLQCLKAIMVTGRVKAARRRQDNAKGPLIQANHEPKHSTGQVLRGLRHDRQPSI